MSEKSWVQTLNSCSDNLKSKSGPADENGWGLLQSLSHSRRGTKGVTGTKGSGKPCCYCGRSAGRGD
jgi:hypothetical protein